MSNVQTLKLEQANSLDLKTFSNAKNIVEKLARIEKYDIQGNPIFTDKEVVDIVSQIITIDLGLKYDENVQLSLTNNNYLYKLDLSKTNYDEDEKANIYYIFYGMHLFVGYLPIPNGNKYFIIPGGRSDIDKIYTSGLTSYWDLTKKNSFLSQYKDISKQEKKVDFISSYYVLAMFYLAINDYKNYEQAYNNGFQPKKGA